MNLKTKLTFSEISRYIDEADLKHNYMGNHMEIDWIYHTKF